ncbi:methyltransferase domain-containing protein [Sporohalobacter salinus]|uniref:methyltransferase domain-containing protein n=1 Tax=Sporohalobacter salinus TaxID=1494606 RepID=UPI001961C05A|nr:methyltransferase domain-containing protein [Sporohalobacter salinus]MBM7623040.1 2-polyprenyl-3-methyl-5-hydroxy-6-metoxy-1,4-benzoquinol methylase [Sporohalobacter salinus]
MKDKIKTLIDDGKLDKVKELIVDYEKNIGKDIEIYSMKSVIAIKEDRLDDAKDILEEGLEIDDDNLDLKFNLGYVYENLGQLHQAINIYENIKLQAEDQEIIEEVDERLNVILNNITESKTNEENYRSSEIKKVLFIQTIPCIRTHKVAHVLNNNGIKVDFLYSHLQPGQRYKGFNLPYGNIYKLKNIEEVITFINHSDYDILYSSNEPDYLTALFNCTDKPIVHDCHDMMSLRGDLSNEEIVLEYIANSQSDGNMYVTDLVEDIAMRKFNLKDKPVINLNNYLLKSMLPKTKLKKLSSIDNELHCVYEGSLSSIRGSHRFLEDIFKKITEAKIHIHIYTAESVDYIKNLEQENKYIHAEGSRSPIELITELTKYDVGLTLFNINQNNKDHINNTFTNKVWDYLAAGLPTLVSDLKATKEFVLKTGIGKVIDYDKDIKSQIKEVAEIDIDDEFLENNNLLMDNKADKIIRFLEKVKNKKIKSQEKQADFYNNMYSDGGYKKMYFKHYEETPYIEVWKRAVEIIDDILNPKIIDIGCGPGQFANLLFDEGVTNYKGIDFSKKAIELARKRNPEYKELFQTDNAYSSDIFSSNYNIVILFEILEHISDDVSIVNRIKSGSQILFSVPNFNSESHVRFFKSKSQIIERYNKLISIDNIDTFTINESGGKIYLIHGIKK